MSTLPIIDTEKFSEHLRERAIKLASREILITNFKGSKEAEDFSLPANCEGFGRLHHFNRSQGPDWPSNPLPIDPAVRALRLPRSDTLQVQVFQNAVCSWRCWYCFVDFDLLSANRQFSDFRTCEQLVDLYLAETPRPLVIDLSGGQPDLVPEWGYWFSHELRMRGLSREVYLWTDDNLSNDYLWRFLNSSQIEELASSTHYGRVGCFKGFDRASFAFNTKGAPDLFEQQFKLMKRLVDARFDVYGYVTLTSPVDANIRGLMSEFVDRLQEKVHPLFPLRTVPLKISTFTPTLGRIDPEKQRAMEIQNVAVAAWSEEIEARYTSEVRSREITEQRLDLR